MGQTVNCLDPCLDSIEQEGNHAEQYFLATGEMEVWPSPLSMQYLVTVSMHLMEVSVASLADWAFYLPVRCKSAYSRGKQTWPSYLCGESSSMQFVCSVSILIRLHKAYWEVIRCLLFIENSLNKEQVSYNGYRTRNAQTAFIPICLQGVYMSSC